MTHLEAFALEGLRTLMVGSKEMSEEDYEEWEEVRNVVAVFFLEILGGFEVQESRSSSTR